MSTTTNQHGDRASQTAAASQQLVDHLDAMVRILRRSIWLSGTHAVLAAALAILLLLIVLDVYLQPESTWLRIVFTVTGIGVVTAAARRFVVRPLQSECSQRNMAWTLEKEYPEMEERLSSALQLTAEKNGTVASPNLVQVVAAEARQRVSQLNKERVARNPMPAVVAASAGGLVVALSFLLWPQFLVPSLKNLISPWNPRVLPHLEALIAPGNTAVISGEPLRITATESERLEGATLEIISEGTVATTYPMDCDAERHTAEFVLPNVTSGFAYRVCSSGLFSQVYGVEVLERPVIEQVSATIEFPEYMRQASVGPFDVTAPIAAPIGSRITLIARSNSDVTQGLLIYGGIPLSENTITQASDPNESLVEWELTVTEDHNQEFEITLSSEHDVHSVSRQIAITPIVDKAPDIQIILPVQRQLTATPQQRLPIRFAATDDVGITAVRLMIQFGDEQTASVDVPVPIAVDQHRADAILDIEELGAALGDNITAWLSVTDSRPEFLGGQQTTRSDKVRIAIEDNAPSFGRQIIEHEQQHIQKQLTEAIDLLKAAAETADAITNALGLETSDEATIHRLARTLQNQIRDARDSLSLLASDQLQMFRSQLDAVNEVVEQELAEALRKASRIPLIDNPQAQKDDAADAQQSLDDAIQKLEAVAEQIAQASGPLELAARLDDLARQQNELAQAERERSQLEAEDPERDQRQRQIADNLQDLVDQDEDARSQQYQMRANQAKELAEDAAELAELQQQLAQIGESKLTDDAKAAADKQKLMELLAREQDAIAIRSREANNADSEPDSPDGLPEPARMDAARELMEETARELRDHNSQEAAKTAKEALDAVKNQETDAGLDEKKGTTARQQERLLAATEDINDGQLEQVVSRLQEQIADRTEELRDDAQRLLEQPSDDEENLEAMEEAKRTLREAIKDTEEAEQRPREQNPERAERDEEPQTQRSQEENQDNKPGADQDAQLKQQQKQAAKTLQQAAQSLEKVCKSCEKCAQCENPSSAPGSSSGGSRRPPQTGSQSPPQAAPTGDPQSDRPDSSRAKERRGRPNPEQLARAADAANRAGQSPSQETLQDAARELNQLADDAARQTDYPFRQSAKRDEQGEEQQAGNNSSPPRKQPGNQAASNNQPGQASGVGQSDAREAVPDSNLRSRSTGNWIRRRKQLRSDVLGDRETRVPEQFRGLVEGYFEELSRQETKQSRTAGDKKQ